MEVYLFIYLFFYLSGNLFALYIYVCVYKCIHTHEHSQFDLIAWLKSAGKLEQMGCKNVLKGEYGWQSLTEFVLYFYYIIIEAFLLLFVLFHLYNLKK